MCMFCHNSIYYTHIWLLAWKTCSTKSDIMFNLEVGQSLESCNFCGVVTKDLQRYIWKTRFQSPVRIITLRFRVHAKLTYSKCSKDYMYIVLWCLVLINPYGSSVLGLSWKPKPKGWWQCMHLNMCFGTVTFIYVFEAFCKLNHSSCSINKRSEFQQFHWATSCDARILHMR